MGSPLAVNSATQMISSANGIRKNASTHSEAHKGGIFFASIAQVKNKPDQNACSEKLNNPQPSNNSQRYNQHSVGITSFERCKEDYRQFKHNLKDFETIFKQFCLTSVTEPKIKPRVARKFKEQILENFACLQNEIKKELKNNSENKIRLQAMYDDAKVSVEQTISKLEFNNPQPSNNSRRSNQQSVGITSFERCKSNYRQFIASLIKSETIFKQFCLTSVTELGIKPRVARKFKEQILEDFACLQKEMNIEIENNSKNKFMSQVMIKVAKVSVEKTISKLDELSGL